MLHPKADLYVCVEERTVWSAFFRAVSVMIRLFEVHADPVCSVTTNCLNMPFTLSGLRSGTSFSGNRTALPSCRTGKQASGRCLLFYLYVCISSVSIQMAPSANVEYISSVCLSALAKNVYIRLC